MNDRCVCTTRRLRSVVTATACLLALVGPRLSGQSPVTNSAVDSASVSGGEGKLPPLPRGSSTVIGGEIRDIDSVLDRFTLRAYGEKPLKVYFDERTQLFRDGKRISLRELQTCEHASVQTTLDGAYVFAVSIHILSQAVAGDYEGEVLDYRPDSGELSVALSAGRKPVKLLVSKDTLIEREGQGQFTASGSGPSDLQAGTLVAIKFDSDNQGHGVASRITIRATPGSSFLFSGEVLSVDAQKGSLLLSDSRDDQRYQISFDPRQVSSSESIRRGQRVRVRAEYDGTKYIAREISPYSDEH